MVKLSSKIFYSLLVVATLLLAIPALFVGVQWLAGICCLSSFLIFLFLNLTCEKKKQNLILYLCFALAYAIRFCRVFMTSVPVFLIGFAATFLVGLVIDCFFFLTYLVNKSKLQFLTPLVFPTCYTALFLLLAIIHFGNTFNLINYFTLITPLTYSLTWANEFGLMFLILLAITLLMEIPFLSFKKGKIIHGVIGAAIVVSLCLSGTCLAIASNHKSPDYTLQVALALSEKRDFDGNSETPLTEEDYHLEFQKRVEEAVAQHADLIVFQEEYSVISLENESEELSFYSKILQTYNIPALIGASIETENQLYKNCAYFFDDSGKLISTYQKVNLIPYIETIDYENGTGGPAYFTTTIADHEINISTIICFDINNDLFLKQLNPATELLLVPSWDWDNGNEEQLKTYVRSIEYNTTVVKHSYDGFSYVSTPKGLSGDIIDNRNKSSSISMVEVPIYKK